ncbi:MAG: hypothetical protein ACYDAY_09810 [Candidatus Dormibacteria bacterium]
MRRTIFGALAVAAALAPLAMALPASANDGAVCGVQAFGAQTSAPVGTITIKYGAAAVCQGIDGTVTATLEILNGGTVSSAGPVSGSGAIRTEGTYSISSIEPISHVYEVVGVVHWKGLSSSSTVPVAGYEFNCACYSG